MKVPDKIGSCLWAGIFAIVFLLSQDHWFLWGDQVRLGPLNFPLRIYYFVFLQFLLAALLGIFLTRWWDRKPNDSDRRH